MRFGICVYKDDVPAAERGGFDYVELTVTNVLPSVSDREFAELKSYLQEFSVKPEAWRRFVPTDYPVVGRDVDVKRLEDFVNVTLTRIAELGGKVVVFGSPGARNIPEGFSVIEATSQVDAFLHLCADWAEKLGITVVIEPITPKNTNHIQRIGEAVDIARRVGRPEVKVLADLYHMHGSGDSVEEVRSAGELLAHIHLPLPEIEGMNEQRAITDRLPRYPVKEFLSELREMGYQERISIEDLDRKFMNIEREAPIVLHRIKAMLTE